MRTPSLVRVLLAHAVLVLASMVVLYPVLWVVKMALTPTQGFDLSLNPFPSDPSLANFREILGATDLKGTWLFGHWLWNSLFLAVTTTLVGIAMATTAAYAFSRFAFPGREGGLRALLVTQMFPGVVMAIPLYILIDKLGLVNSISGLVLVYSTTSIPFCIYMLKGYFDTIPKDLEEAAVIDGAGRWTIFTRLILPLARPAIVVTALFSFMTAWNEYILAATFLQAETSYTLPVVLQRYIGSFDTQWGLFAAGSILVSLPVMLLFFALQRHLVGGLTAGGVKG